ncbi:hypothetical protein BH23CHL2_BH23CHL2_06720 [soil metagenome]
MTVARFEPPDIPRAAASLLDSPYARYLEVAALYEIQGADPATDSLRQPEELLFRTIHLVSELWLRLAGAEIGG